MNTRGIRCMKFFLTLFNIICILFALMVVGMCVMNMRVAGGGGGVSRGALAFLVSLSLALLAAAALGCVAALREHVKTLYTHACFFIFLVSVEVVVGAGGAAVSALAGRGGAPSPLRASFFRNVTALEDGGAAHIAYWDKLQAEYGCCGVDGPADYAAAGRPVPASCCAGAGAGAGAGVVACSPRGCERALAERAAVKRNVFISTSVVLVLIEISCIALALCLARGVRRERRRLQRDLQAHFET